MSQQIYSACEFEPLTWKKVQDFRKLIPQYHNLPSLKQLQYFYSRAITPVSLSFLKSLLRDHKGYLFSVVLEMYRLNLKTT